VLLLTIIYTINLPVVRPRSCRVIYYFDTPPLGKRHQSFDRVNEVSISNLENKFNDLTSLVRSLACGNVQQVKVCSICSLPGYASDMCQQCKKITLNMLMQLMEHSTDNPSVNIIPFLTRTILDGEIISTYAMGTHLNKVIKADSSIPMDFNPNRIIKQDNPLNLQTPMLWDHHPTMIFVR